MLRYVVMTFIYWASMFVAFLFLPIATCSQILLPALMVLYADFVHNTRFQR